MDRQLSPSSCSSSSTEQHSPVYTDSPSTSLSPITPSSKRKAGRKKFRETRHPVYCGVRHRHGGKWVCEIREPCTKNRIWLGTYPTPEMAARAHDVAAIALRGDAAQLNFPDSFSTLPRAKSASPDDIRKAVSQAADMFRSSEPAASLHTNGINGITTGDQRMEEVCDHKSPGTPISTPIPVSEFVDEEELYNMPGLLNSMAEGMLLTPLAMQQGFNWDGVDCDVELSLWNDQL